MVIKSKNVNLKNSFKRVEKDIVHENIEKM